MTEYICEVIEPPAFDSYHKIAFLKEVVRCKDCEMCKEYEIYDDKGNVKKVEFRCARPIMFLKKGGMYTQEMSFGYGLNGMNIVLQNVKLDGFCSWGKRKENG